MPNPWTPERVAILSQSDRNSLWEKAVRSGNEQLVDLIEHCGLPYSNPVGLKLDSYIGKEMARIINSPEGVQAAIAATEQGYPALGGVEPLLIKSLGKLYLKTFEATIQAGYLVAGMMKRKGYVQTGMKGSIHGPGATTGEIYKAES